MTDEDQIRQLFAEICRTWSAGDADAYGACFTVDCDYVSFDGYWERGREPVVAAHDKLFGGVLYGSRLVGDVEGIRHLGDGVALVHATGSVLVAWRNDLPRSRRTRNTLVVVREGPGSAGRWLCTAIHNGRIRPVGVPDPQSLVATIARGIVRASRRLGLPRLRATPTPAPASASATWSQTD